MGKKGFTLIELLVVIAIIALLLSVILPSLRAAKGAAQKTICMSNTRQLSQLVFLYAIDNDDSFNRGYMDSQGYLPETSWLVAYSGYAGDKMNAFTCPSTKLLDENVSRAGNHRAAWPRAWDAGNDPWIRDTAGSYGKNGWCSNPDILVAPSNEVRPGLTRSKALYRKISEVKNSANLPFFVDCFYYFTIPSELDVPWPEGPHGRGWADYPSTCMGWSTLDRHRKGEINAAFGDGSAGSVHIKKLWELNWHKDWSLNSGFNKYTDERLAPWPDWMRGL